jgi:anti-anti-sigma factor
MDYSVELRGDNLAVVKLSGKITIYQLQRFKDLLGEIKRRIGNRKRLIFDFAGLQYMDSLALGIIVAFSKEFREEGGDIRIIHMNGDLGLIFDLSRLSKVYEVYDDIEEAKRSFI